MENQGLPEDENGREAFLGRLKEWMRGLQERFWEGSPELAGGKKFLVPVVILLVAALGYMLYPKQVAPPKIVMNAEPERVVEKPVTLLATSPIQGKGLRNPFSKEHELRENMPEMLAMEGKGDVGNGPTIGGTRGTSPGKTASPKTGSGGASPTSTTPKLTGILFGENESLAILNLGDKNISLAIGETIEGVTLTALEGDWADIEWKGQTLRLDLN